MGFHGLEVLTYFVCFPVKQHKLLSDIITAHARTQKAHTNIRKSEGCFRLRTIHPVAINKGRCMYCTGIGIFSKCVLCCFA